MRLALLPLLIIGFAAPASWAQTTCVNGRCVSVQVPDTRRAQLRSVATQLARANVPGYGVLYKTTRSKRPTEGAMLVTAVERNSDSIRAWYDTVGQQSIGFQASMGPTAGSVGSGYVRVGKEFMTYSWVRGEGYSGGSEDIHNHYGQLTEATYLVTPQEMAAFRAFYHARNRKLIKDGKGRAIDPEWKNPGKCNLKQEACAGAASSALNTAWVKYFGRSLSAIKAYGQANNIPELANAPDNSARLIRDFMSRTGARQQADPRALVRVHSPSADLLTVFNSNLGQRPIDSLKWARDVQWYTKPSGQRVRDKWHKVWTGMGTPYTIMDLHSSETNKTFKAERVELRDFAGGL